MQALCVVLTHYPLYFCLIIPSFYPTKRNKGSDVWAGWLKNFRLYTIYPITSLYRCSLQPIFSSEPELKLNETIKLVFHWFDMVQAILFPFLSFKLYTPLWFLFFIPVGSARPHSSLVCPPWSSAEVDEAAKRATTNYQHHLYASLSSTEYPRVLHFKLEFARTCTHIRTLHIYSN